MPTVQKTLRIPEEVAKAISELAEIHGRDFSATANELLMEAVKVRRCPGIDFVGTPTGRRSARIVGSGLEVWEVISGYQSLDKDWNQFTDYYRDMLSETQLRAALAYYQLYPEEIDRAIAENADWTPETFWKDAPFSKPPWR